MPAFAQNLQPPHTLVEMRDRYRPLLIFSPPYDIQTKVMDQIRFLELHRSELLQRQVVLVPFFTGGLGCIIDTELVDIYLVDQEQSLRRRFHIHPNDFTVILLGKDGGEKFRSHTPVTVDKLNRIIDAMPMRQSEMRARNPH